MYKNLRQNEYCNHIFKVAADYSSFAAVTCMHLTLTHLMLY